MDQTVISKYKNFSQNIRGIRYDGIAASMLTYIYLSYMTDFGVGEIKSVNLDKKSKNAPLFTKLIADWNVHKFEFGENTRYFQAAFNEYNFEPESKKWLDFFTDEKYITYKLVDDGKIIIKYRNNRAKEFLSTFGFKTLFCEKMCYAANIQQCSSEYFKSARDYDIYIAFAFDGNVYTVSLYTTKSDINVAEIARKYGGGGHAKAAGFVCKELPFKILRNK